jgi:GNAT superfamily N-acetyltransferase
MIQMFTKADVKRISHLQPDGWEDIIPFFQFYTEASFCHAIKIEEKTRIVAIGSMILLGRTAWFAHIIVAPHMHRTGLGSVITRELISCAEKNGCNTQLLIATAMGLPLYEHFGFRRSCDYMYYHKHSCRELLANPNIRRLNPADAAEILAIDQHATGEDRSTMLSLYGDTGWVYIDSDGKTIRGCLLPNLGEGAIVAENEEAGTALMELRLATLETAPVLPAGNQAAKGFLGDLGINLKRTATRMVRNGNDPLDQRMIFNRIGGHIG